MDDDGYIFLMDDGGYIFLMDDDGYMRSSKSKSELLQYIRFEQIPYNDLDIGNNDLFVDFMAYARKLDRRITKCGLKTFGDFALNIWNTIIRHSVTSNRIDIVFGNYLMESVKSGERKKRAAANEAVQTAINYVELPLPPVSELPKFSACDDNKKRLQQFFIAWIEER